MKIDGNAIRPGHVLEHKKRLWRVSKTQHVKPGKGGAFLQCEMKDIRSGTKLNERFRASEAVKRIRLQQKNYQFLFSNGQEFTFMNSKNYEQLLLPLDIVGEYQALYLSDGMIVSIEEFDGEIIGIALPKTVILEISEAEELIKGQTATSSFKPAILENGIRTLVPSYIEAGIKVVINTADGSYLERAK